MQTQLQPRNFKGIKSIKQCYNNSFFNHRYLEFLLFGNEHIFVHVDEISV